ncbi:recombinase RecT, partial [Acidobacteria bacterium AH-259-A15]|nr:recombinase RecT [Acidobacteria bacterium AH-259-A15]
RRKVKSMNQQIANRSAFDIESLLYDAQSQIAQVLPRHIAPEKMITVALELVRGDSTLQRCLSSQEGAISIVQGVVEASQLGLLLTRNLGHGYLVPFKHGVLSESKGQNVYLAQFMIGYRGFVHLCRRGDQNVAHIYSRIVFPTEAFDIDEGSGRQLYHKPNLEGGVVNAAPDGTLSGFLGAYSMVIFKDGTPPDFEWMPLREIQKCRNASKARSSATPWQQWPEEMIKKTATRRLCKRLELSPELTAAFVRDEYRELVNSDHQLQPAPRMQMPRRRSEPMAVTPEPDRQEDSSGLDPPTCEGHGPMVLKSAGRKKNGDPYPAFYGCSKYPECRKTVKASVWEEQQRQAQLPETAEKPKAKPKKITKKEKEDLLNKAGDLGWTDAEFKKLLERFGYARAADITTEHLGVITEHVEAGMGQ